MMPNQLPAKYTFTQFLRACSALTRIQLRLAARERAVLFFNYIFPLVFFFGFGAFMGGRGVGAAMTRVVSMVIVLGILGSGLFGAGLRAVTERETGILRRYRVAPITPLPILIASIITGWILYLPSAVLIILLSHFIYQIPLPSEPLSLLVVVTLGCFAFRAIGLIIAAVANSAAESNVLVQLLYMPMLFLSGATFPISSMPVSAQIVSQFMPASYLNSGIHHVMLRAEGLAANPQPVGALLLTTVLAVFISSKIFRWEKEEKVGPRAKAWVAAVLLPFILLGTYQAYSRDHINEAKQLDRQIRRSQARLIRGATIFTGDGKVLVNGAILVRNGKIEQLMATAPPNADGLNAEVLEAAGKTVIPGLIDAYVQLPASGGVFGHSSVPDRKRGIERALAAYLYSGVTTVRNVGDADPAILDVRKTVNPGSLLGAELFIAGPKSIESDPPLEPLPNDLFDKMAKEGTFFIPRLAYVEALVAGSEKRADFLNIPMVQQVVKPEFLEPARAAFLGGNTPGARLGPVAGKMMAAARENLIRAWRARVPLAAGTGSGNVGLFHGPAIHRELKLWVDAGVPIAATLQAATSRPAALLRASERIGTLRPGADATVVIIDGNPLVDIAATERIASILFKGELVYRSELFDQK
ncbi:MAG: ABC transporter permease [Bryobacterales bacterium]|nr:ABC transporter permease [Bryobacterales bacterium]